MVKSSAKAFVTLKQVKAIHQQQILTFGSKSEILDEGKLETAVYRPQNLYNYDNKATIYDLAASIGWGITNNHTILFLITALIFYFRLKS